jgi:hypothetical protein
MFGEDQNYLAITTLVMIHIFSFFVSVLILFIFTNFMFVQLRSDPMCKPYVVIAPS